MSIHRVLAKLSGTTVCFLLAISDSAGAFNLTFNADASTEASVDANAYVGEVYEDVEASTVINQTNNPDGFESFFAEPFFLLGAASNTTIPDDDHTLGASVAVFDIEVTTENANKDIFINFDWTFQGDSNGILGTKVDYFTFSVFELSVNPLDPLNISYSNEIELLLTNEYQEQSNQTLTISGGLPVGTYSLQASVIEPSVNDDAVVNLIDQEVERYITDEGLDPVLDAATIATFSTNTVTAVTSTLLSDNSAAGIGNLTINAVPFEFSPTLGLLACGSFWGLAYLRKQRNRS